MAGKGMRARIRAWMMDYAYLVTAGAMAAVVAASAIYTHQLRKEEGVQAAADAPETAVQETMLPAVTPLPTIAPLAVHTELLTPAGSTAWPASGEIIRGYEPQEVVCWEALGCFRPHAGLDIAGAAGEEVTAIADGVAETVQRDALWGCQVVISQTDGRRMRYAGLETAYLAAGQSVTRGQAIGTMMPYIPCEAELGAHVHVEMTKDGKHQDPGAILPEKRSKPSQSRLRPDSSP